MSIRMRPAPTAGVNGRNADGGTVAGDGEPGGPGASRESRMQQYMRRVLEAGQRNARAEQAPSQPPSAPARAPSPKPSAKRNASAKDDGATPDDANGAAGAKAPRTQPQPQPQSQSQSQPQSIASVVDAFAAATVTGGTLMVHEWTYAASGARAGQKRVGIYSGQQRFGTAHENAQFLMKLALQDALGAQLNIPDSESNWTLVTGALHEWQSSVGVGTNAAPFGDLDTSSGRNWEKLEDLIHALCVLMKTSVVVADHLAGNGESTATATSFAPAPDAMGLFVATDAWRGARDGYDALNPAPPNVPAFEPGSRLDAYKKLKDMEMKSALTMEHEPYVWLGLFLQYRITAPGAERGFSKEVSTLLASIGKHFLTSYASAEYALDYELSPEKGFTYDSSVTDKFQRMPKVAHGFQWPVYDQVAWDFSMAQDSQTTWDAMHDDLALERSFLDSYNHADANVFDPADCLTIVYEVSAEDGNESGDEGMESD